MRRESGERITRHVTFDDQDEAIFSYYFDFDYAVDPTTFAAHFFVDAAGVENDQFVVDKRGFAAIVARLARTFVARDALRLDTQIASIDTRRRLADDSIGVALRATSGTTFLARRAIVTASVGVLHAQDLLFTPPLAVKFCDFLFC